MSRKIGNNSFIRHKIIGACNAFLKEVIEMGHEVLYKGKGDHV